MFAEELERALKIVAILPGAGTIYAKSPVPDYTFDDKAVVIRALWSAH